jgi:putative stress-induced transcription regulator
VKHIYPVIRHVFAPKDFVGGDAVLDFVNTVNGRDQAPCDWLDGYPRLLEWAGHAKLLPDKVLHVLQAMVQADPAAASAALRRTKELHEALFVVITAMILGKGPPKGAMDVLSRHWQAGVAAHELRYEGRRVRLEMHAGARPRSHRFVDRVPLRRKRIAGAVGPAAYLRGQQLLVGVSRSLESRPPALVRHGRMWQQRQVTPLPGPHAAGEERETGPGVSGAMKKADSRRSPPDSPKGSSEVTCRRRR